MRILHMLPDIGIANGVMSVVLNYAKAMPDDIKFDVVYFQQSEKTKQNEIEAIGGRVFRINPPSPKTALKREMDKFFKEHKGEWEAVHIHAPHFAIFMAPAARRAGIKKVCIHCHSTWYSLLDENKKRNKLFYDLGKVFVDKKFACGRDAGRFWYGEDKNFTVLPNAIDCAKFRFNEKVREEKRRELDIEDKFVVGHLGRVEPPQKNHPFLLEIFSQIKKLEPNSVLLMTGADENDELKKLAKKLGIYDSIRFLGSRKDVPQLSQAYDVFVFPSFWEGLPVSVVEAQAAGLPVVMSDSITDEVVATDNVCMLSLDNPAAEWAQKATELAEMPRKDTYELMKSAGWDIYDNGTRLAEYYRG